MRPWAGLLALLPLFSCATTFPVPLTWTQPYLQASFRVGEKVWAPWPDRRRVYLGVVQRRARAAYQVAFPNGDVGLFHGEELRAVRLLRGEFVLCYDEGDYLPARVTGLGAVLEVELEDGSRRQPTLVALPRSQAVWPAAMP